MGQHRLHAEALGQFHHTGRRRAVAHDQAGARRSAALGERLQHLVQLQHAGVDELHTSVLSAGQRLENVGIEDKQAVHLIKPAQRVIERGMVGAAQVTPHPYQRT